MYVKKMFYLCGVYTYKYDKNIILLTNNIIN